MREAHPAYGRKQEKEQTKDRGAKGNPAFIGQEEGKPEEGTGRGVSELTASSAAPDDGAARNRLGPITAAALLGSFFSLLRRMNVPYHYVRFLAGIPGSRVGVRDDLSCHLALDALRVTPHCDAGSRLGRQRYARSPSGLWEKAGKGTN